ncbi:MAG: hypothetical protein VW274_09135, partial [Thalassolituus sp.]
PPHWLEVGRVLNQLSQTRHNRAQRYESAIAAPDKKLLDLSSDSSSGYLVFGRDEFIQKQISSANVSKAVRTRSELERLRNDAIGLVAERFGISADDMSDRSYRRQYHRLMPLAAWLLRQRDLCDETIADLLNEDEDIIPIWIRGIPAEHPQALTDRLSALWTPRTQTIATAATQKNGPAKRHENDAATESESADDSSSSTSDKPDTNKEDIRARV